MALGKAIKFVKQVGYDNALRKTCNMSSSRQELLYMLDFNEREFEDAINMQLIACQTYEEADHFHQIKQWFVLL